MTWTIRIPFRRGSTPLQAAGDANILDAQDRDVTRALLTIAAEQNIPTVDDLAQRLEEASPEQRLHLYNQARARCWPAIRQRLRRGAAIEATASPSPI